MIPEEDGTPISLPVRIEVPARVKKFTAAWDPDHGDDVYEELEPAISQEEIDLLKEQAMTTAHENAARAWKAWQEKQAAPSLSEDELIKLIMGDKY